LFFESSASPSATHLSLIPTPLFHGLFSRRPLQAFPWRITACKRSSSPLPRDYGPGTRPDDFLLLVVDTGITCLTHYVFFFPSGRRDAPTLVHTERPSFRIALSPSPARFRFFPAARKWILQVIHFHERCCSFPRPGLRSARQLTSLKCPTPIGFFLFQIPPF